MNESSLNFLPGRSPGEGGSYRKSVAAGKGKAGVQLRAVVQRVREASVAVGGEPVSAIGPGLLVLLGVGREDKDADADYLAEKIVHLRIFEDESGQMNRSVLDTRGALLVVSQFTLYGDTRRGRRPGYSAAAAPDDAVRLYRYFVERVSASGLEVREGVFRAMMDVHLVNSGPVTLLIDSTRAF
jgi:D-tyrosyl-tRNA(Tyr) deacylase